MALTSGNVRVAVTGVVSVGPTATAAPTSTSSALAAGFLDVGYISEDGVVESYERTAEDIKAWQNADNVRTVVTDGKATFTFTMIESSKTTLETYYGATTSGATATDGTLSVVPTATGGRKSWVIDVVDGAEKKRIYIAEGEVTERGEVSHVSGDATAYQVTVTAYPVSGVSVKIFHTALKTP